MAHDRQVKDSGEDDQDDGELKRRTQTDPTYRATIIDLIVVANLFAVSTQTITRLVKTGRIPRPLCAGRKWFWTEHQYRTMADLGCRPKGYYFEGGQLARDDGTELRKRAKKGK